MAELEKTLILVSKWTNMDTLEEKMGKATRFMAVAMASMTVFTGSTSMVMGSNEIQASASSKPVLHRKTIKYYVGNKSKYYEKMWQSAIYRWNHGTNVHYKGKKVWLFSRTKNKNKADMLLTACNKFKWTYDEQLGDGYYSYYDKASYGEARIHIDVANENGVNWSQRRNAAMHEIGHAMGMKHSEDSNSIMTYTDPVGKITKADQKNLEKQFQELARS